MGGFSPVIIMQIDDSSRMERLHDLRGGGLGREGGGMISFYRFGMSVLILAFSLALSGCLFSHPVDTDVGKWIVKIKKSEEKSKEMIKNILATVKDQADIQNARNLYVEAETQNNACITLSEDRDY